MLRIKCPWCGSRDQSEFSYGGEAHIVRPEEPEKLSDEELKAIKFYNHYDIKLFNQIGT